MSKTPSWSLISLLAFNWWQGLFSFAVFNLKSAHFKLFPVALAGIIAVLSESDEYPSSYAWWILAGITSVFLLHIPAHVLHVRIISARIRQCEWQLRSSLIRCLQNLSMTFHTKSEAGRLHARVIRDVEMIQQTWEVLIQHGYQFISTILVVGLVTMINEPVLFLYLLLVCPMSAILVTLFRKRLSAHNESFRDKMEQTSGYMNSMIRMIPLTRAHGLEASELSKAEKQLDDIYSSGMSLDRMNSWFSAISFTSTLLSQSLALAVCIYFYQKGVLTIAEIVMYQGFFTMLSNQFTNILGVLPIVSKGRESVKSIGELLCSHEIEIHRGEEVPKEVTGNIEFCGVSFTYPNKSKPALELFNLKIEQGDCVALVGESGSGKSTIINLLLGFYKPKIGEIVLEGIPQFKMKMNEWRKSVSVVPQEVILFNGSLLENICYGCGEIEEKKFLDAIKVANLQDVIDDLPDGLDTEIGENGIQMSGGQRQRIAIARAFIRDPKIVILDEATSALDVMNEKKVQEAINGLIKTRTTFIIAHRLSTIRQANKIVVMKAGKCIEMGSHGELIDHGEEFKRLKALSTEL